LSAGTVKPGPDGAGSSRDDAPLILLGIALFAAVALLLVLATDLTFFQDTWDFLLQRQGFNADAYLAPHNEHIVVAPVAIEQLLVGLFGTTSAMPEFVVLALMLAGAAALLFVYVRRRLGPWPALLAALLLLFLGPAWQVLLWPFEIGFVGSVLFGIAMLLALENDDRRWDRAACAFLALSVAFSSLGLAFLVGAAVDVLQRRRSRGWGRAYVVAVPLVLYAAWYAGWGHSAENHLSAHNVLTSPRYLLEGVASSLGSLLGLSGGSVAGTGVSWGALLLVAAVVLVAYGQARKRGFSSRLWPVLATTVTFWLLAGFSYIPGREADSSRYLYAGAALVLLLAADLMRGIRLGRAALLVAGVVTIAAVASNLVPLENGRDWLQAQSVLTRADLAAMDIAERTISPSFALTPEIAGNAFLIDVDETDYAALRRDHGTPAYDVEELLGASETARLQADSVLAQALPLSTLTHLGGYDPHPTGVGRCLTLPAGGAVALSPGTTLIELAPGPDAAFSLRRFSRGEYPVATEGAAGGSMTTIRVPRDAAPQVPWHLRVQATQQARVCH
jgi:hypothetical protein